MDPLESSKNVSANRTRIVAEAAQKAQHRAVRRIRAVPWGFASIGIFVTLATVAAVVSLDYTETVQVIEQLVAARAESVLNGAVEAISDYFDMSVEDSNIMINDFTRIGNTSTSPMEALVNMTSRVLSTFVSQTLSDPTDMGYGLDIMGPVVTPDAYPEQVISEQNGCLCFCARPGDPVFTEIAEVFFIKDSFYDAAQNEFRIILSDNKLNSSFYRVTVANRTKTAPSWALSSPNINAHIHTAVMGPKYRTGSSLVQYQNGTAFDGIWNPVAVTSAPSGKSYYFFAYRKAFIHPLSNLTMILTNLQSAFQVQDVVVEYTKQIGGNNGHLILVDGIPRVLAYNQDPWGDGRLANCTITSVPGSVGRSCGGFTAVTHPSQFVRELFQRYQGFILQRSSQTRQVWFTLEGTRYLLVVRSILDEGATRLIATVALRESDVVGSLKRDSIVISVVSAAVVTVAGLLLTAAGFISLHGAQRTVGLAAKLAVRIAHYDLEASESLLQRHRTKKSLMCFSAASPLEAQFREIVDNLREYRPYLPAALLAGTLGRRRTAIVFDDELEALAPVPSSGSSASTSPKNILPANRGNRFRVVSGSLVLIDVANMPISTNVSRHDEAQIGQIVANFLKRALWVVEQYGGVVEVIRATQILVSFNCHTVVRHHEDVACRCALELRSTLHDASLLGHALNVAISVASGSGIVGSAGSSSVKARMLAGECVDLIRRLPALQRMLGVPVLATEATAWGLSGSVLRVPVDVIAPCWWQANRTTLLKVYGIVGCGRTVSQQMMTLSQMHLTAFNKLIHRDPQAAVSVLECVPASKRSAFEYVRLLAACRAAINRPNSRFVRREVAWDELETPQFYESTKLDRARAMLLDTALQLQPLYNATTELLLAHKAQAALRADLFDFCAGVGDGDDTVFASRESDSLERSMPLFGMFVKKIQASCSNSLAMEGEDAFGDFPLPLSEVCAAVPSPAIISSSTTTMRTSEGGATSTTTKNGGLLNRIQSLDGDFYLPVGRTLGSGSFGTVVLALHEKGGLVAMKLIPLDVLDSGVEPLVREMELLSSLSHPNIAGYVTCAINRQDGVFCIMTEFLPAGSLYDIILAVNTITDGVAAGLPLRAVLNYAREIVQGLDYLHSHSPPILHLDIKPQNVLMTTEGSCRLIDFGTSKFFVEAGSSTTIRGTPRYMAPEAAMGEFTPASDMYSVGITMLHMLLGRLPWDHINGDDTSFLMMLSQTETAPSPHIPSRVPTYLRLLLEKCTAANPTNRPTAKEFLRVLSSRSETPVE